MRKLFATGVVGLVVGLGSYSPTAADSPTGKEVAKATGSHRRSGPDRHASWSSSKAR